MNSPPRLKRHMLSAEDFRQMRNVSKIEEHQTYSAGETKIMKMASPPKPRRCLSMLNDLIKNASSLKPTCTTYDIGGGASTSGFVPVDSSNTHVRPTDEQFEEKLVISHDVEQPPILQDMSNLSTFTKEVAAQRKLQTNYISEQEKQLREMQENLSNMKSNQIALLAKKRHIARSFSQLCDETTSLLKDQMTSLGEEILQLMHEEKLLRYKIASHSNSRCDECRYRKLMQSHVNAVTQEEESQHHAEFIENIKEKIKANENASAILLEQLQQERASCCTSETNDELSALKTEKEKVLAMKTRKKDALEREEETVRKLKVEFNATRNSVVAQNARLKSRCLQSKLHLQQLDEEAFAFRVEVKEARKRLK